MHYTPQFLYRRQAHSTVAHFLNLLFDHYISYDMIHKNHKSYFSGLSLQYTSIILFFYNFYKAKLKMTTGTS